jgi:hypothetical protein
MRSKITSQTSPTLSVAIISRDIFSYSGGSISGHNSPLQTKKKKQTPFFLGFPFMPFSSIVFLEAIKHAL